MTIRTVDSRQAEADREFSYWCQKGVPPKVVTQLLPMLVGPLGTARAAERWLSQHGAIGQDMSPEGQAAYRRTVVQARQLHNSALNSGAFTGTQVYRSTPGRYDPSDAEVDTELDRQAPTKTFGTGNAKRLRLSDLEADAQRRHHNPRLVLHDDGRLTDPLGNVVERIKVETPKPDSRVRVVDDEVLYQHDVTFEREQAWQAAHDGSDGMVYAEG